MSTHRYRACTALIVGVVFTFPGQGAQRPGMLAELPDSAAVRDTLAEAESVLECGIDTLDKAEALAHTKTVQLALAIAGVAAARHLIAEEARPDAVMGLSIGAFAAAVVVGALDFADALTLVAARSRFMADAYPNGYGMSAVLGLSESAVREIVEKPASDKTQLYVGNVNSDDQIVVAGSDAALAQLAEAANKVGAARVQRLDMAVPSHCALMDAPAARLFEAARNVSFNAPRLAYFSANRRRRLWRAADIADDLIYNMARTVYWAASARIVHESGFELAVEMPHSRVLTRLHPAMEPPGEAVAVVDTGWHNTAALIRRASGDIR